MSVTEDTYTQKQVAEIFKVHDKTVNRWWKTGKLSAEMVDGKLRYKKSEVHALLRNQEVPPEIANRRPPNRK